MVVELERCVVVELSGAGLVDDGAGGGAGAGMPVNLKVISPENGFVLLSRGTALKTSTASLFAAVPQELVALLTVQS